MHTIVLFYTSYKRVSILTTMGMRYIRYACNGGSSARSVPSIVTKRYPCWTEFISKSARHLGETLVSERDRCKKMDILAVYIPWGAYSRVCTTLVSITSKYVKVSLKVGRSYIFQPEQKHIRVPQVVVKYIEATI